MFLMLHFMILFSGHDAALVHAPSWVRGSARDGTYEFNASMHDIVSGARCGMGACTIMGLDSVRDGT